MDDSLCKVLRTIF